MKKPVFMLQSKCILASVILALLATYDMFPGGEIVFFEKIRFLSIRQAVSCPSSGQTSRLSEWAASGVHSIISSLLPFDRLRANPFLRVLRVLRGFSFAQFWPYSINFLKIYRDALEKIETGLNGMNPERGANVEICRMCIMLTISSGVRKHNQQNPFF